MKIAKSTELAEIYKSKRLEKKLSIDAVHSLTRINKEFIESIENARFDLLPKAYERIFLKSYADFLGLDFKDLVLNYIDSIDDYPPAKYETEKHNDNMQPSFSENEPFNQIVTIKNFLNKNKQTFLWLPLMVILLLFFIILRNQFSNYENEAVKELSLNEQLNRVDTITIDTNKVKKSIHQSDSLKLEITVLEPVTFVVIADSSNLKRIVAKKVDTYTFKGKKQLNLFCENGSKIEIVYNDKNMGIPTKADTKINFMIFDKNGVKSRGFSAIESPNKIKTKSIRIDSLNIGIE